MYKILCLQARIPKIIKPPVKLQLNLSRWGSKISFVKASAFNLNFEKRRGQVIKIACTPAQIKFAHVTSAGQGII